MQIHNLSHMDIWLRAKGCVSNSTINTIQQFKLETLKAKAIRGTFLI